MGRVIRRGDVISKATSMNAELSNLLAAVQSTQKAFDEINAKDTQLTGVAWKGFRKYMRLIQLPILDAYIYWTQIMTEANDKYSQAAGKLSAAVLDEAMLKESRNQYQKQIDHCNNSPLLAQNLGAHHCIVEYCYKMIKMIDKKIDEINAFDSGTSGLYSEAASTLAVLERAKTEIGKVTFDSGLKTYNLSGISPEFRTKLDEIHGKKVLKDAGIDATELEKLKAEGIYTQEEMANLIENCETADDRTFVVDMLLKKYSEAFQINPNKLSETSDYMMAEHANRLYQAGRLAELQDLNNGILDCNSIYNTEIIGGEIAGEGDIRYRDIYLKKMRDGMQVICGMEKKIMQGVPSTEMIYTAQETRNTQNRQLLNLWETEMVYINTLKPKGTENLLNIKVTAFCQDLSQAEISHYSGEEGKVVKDVISVVSGKRLQIEGLLCNGRPTDAAIVKERFHKPMAMYLDTYLWGLQFENAIKNDVIYSSSLYNNRRNKNKNYNDTLQLEQFPEAITPDGYIKNQNMLGDEAGFQYSYKDKNASSMGCGPVAVYNVLKAVGDEVPFQDVLYGTDINIVGGGAHMFVMGDYLEDQGYDVTYLIGDDIEKESEHYDALIVTCANLKLDGHYFTMIPTKDKNPDGENLYHFYNGYTKKYCYDYQDTVATFADGVVETGKERNLDIHVAIGIKKQGEGAN